MQAQHEGGASPAPWQSPEAGPSLSPERSACTPAKANTRHSVSPTPAKQFAGLRENTRTHVDAGVVGEDAIVGQCDIFLFPLFVERAPTALQQDALMAIKMKKAEGGECIPNVCCACFTHFGATKTRWAPATPTVHSSRRHGRLRRVMTQHDETSFTQSEATAGALSSAEGHQIHLICSCVAHKSVSYLFDGDESPAAKVALKVCTPSVWVAASPSLRTRKEGKAASVAGKESLVGTIIQ